jgi:hypothetical protein
VRLLCDAVRLKLEIIHVPFHVHCRSPMKSEVIALVMLIMPELQDLCGESSPPLSMVRVEVVSLGPSVVASM